MGRSRSSKGKYPTNQLKSQGNSKVMNIVNEDNNSKEESNNTVTSLEQLQAQMSQMMSMMNLMQQRSHNSPEDHFAGQLSGIQDHTSAFVLKLASREELLLGNVNVSPKSKVLEDTSLLQGGSNTGLESDNCAMDVSSRGLTFCDHPRIDIFESKAKSSLKPSHPRTSTLMKPTASQLAKQNRQRLVENYRFQKFGNTEMSTNNSTNEIQAPKRQKLEGGHLHKVAETMQPINLIHKAPKREGITEGNLTHGRLRLTIPREPALETAHRAQRIRQKTNKEHEHVPSAAPAFKALPLNRKILEAPSLSLPKRSTPHLPKFQEFHLKTSERAMQHSSAVSSSSAYCNDAKVMQKPSVASVTEGSNSVYRRPYLMDAPRQEGCESTHKFKALPLNKKIFSSKGDLGVFRNSKRETTVPMEFNFHTEKRFQQEPPVDLFNKLSLTSELQQSTSSQLRLPRSTSVFEKGSKENRLASFQQESEIKGLARERTSRFGASRIQHGSDNWATEVAPVSRISRSLGIR